MLSLKFYLGGELLWRVKWNHLREKTTISHHKVDGYLRPFKRKEWTLNNLVWLQSLCFINKHSNLPEMKFWLVSNINITFQQLWRPQCIYPVCWGHISLKIQYFQRLLQSLHWTMTFLQVLLLVSSWHFSAMTQN